MIRALIELIFAIVVLIAARGILTTVLRGLIGMSSNPSQTTPSARPTASEPGPSTGRELHKDPVCGTYVAESTPFQRRAGAQTFYYCSEDCRGKHALVAR